MFLCDDRASRRMSSDKNPSKMVTISCKSCSFVSTSTDPWESAVRHNANMHFGFTIDDNSNTISTSVSASLHTNRNNHVYNFGSHGYYYTKKTYPPYQRVNKPTPGPLRHLKNAGKNLCYLNCLLQILGACYLALGNTTQFLKDPKSPLSILLQSIICDEKVHMVDELAKEIQDRFSLKYGSPNDSAALLTHLIKHFIEVEERRFLQFCEVTFSHLIKPKCGCYQEQNQIEKRTHVLVDTNDDTNSMSEHFQQMLNFDDICSQCKSQELLTDNKMELRNLPEILLVATEQDFDYSRFKVIDVPGSEKEKVNSYRLIGAALHTGTPQNGHYVALVYITNTWWDCSDGKISIEKAPEFRWSERAKLLVYQREGKQ